VTTTAVAGTGRTGPRPSAVGARRRSPTTLAGTWRLARFMLRRDRVRIPVWIASIAGTVWFSAASIQALYPTQADLDAAAAPLYDNAAVIALQGPTYAIDTLGGNIVFNIGAFGYVAMALMGMFLVGRHTRADEEEGRTELVRATVVGRNAPVTAALTVTSTALTLTGALITLAMLTLDLPVAGSVAYGAAMAGFGAFFAGATAVAAQVSEHNRTAYGLTGAALGLSFVLRAVGDVGSGALSWLSPMGWAQSVRPYADERWWPLALLAGGTLALLAVAYELLSRRDLGSGMIAPRPGPPVAAPWLPRPWGLAVRLQRGALVAWAAGLVLGGAAYGSLGEDVADLVGDSEQLNDLLAQAAGNLTDSFFATALLTLAVVAGGFTISSALKPRSEETGGRAEQLLATALSRWRWAGSHLAVAVAGSVVLMVAIGAGMGATYALIVGDAGEVARLTVAALAFAPALWVLAGFATALAGLAPRATAATWALFAWCALVGFLGSLLGLPQWAMDLSPFQHVPLVPAEPVEWLPLVALTLVAAALAAAGLAGLRRRDAGF
jgi:ABC-2 type transport system permease protein